MVAPFSTAALMAAKACSSGVAGDLHVRPSVPNPVCGKAEDEAMVKVVGKVVKKTTDLATRLWREWFGDGLLAVNLTLNNRIQDQD